MNDSIENNSFLQCLEVLAKELGIHTVDETASVVSETESTEVSDNHLIKEEKQVAGLDKQTEVVHATEAGESSRKGQAVQLVELAEHLGVTFFHATDKTCYASILDSGHRENHPVNGLDFQEFLIKAYYQATGGVASTNAIKAALAVCEGKARFEGECQEVFLRLAAMDGSIYLDLGTEDWSAVCITAEGWEIIAEPPVRFVRPYTMQALPRPVLGGAASEILDVLNINQEDWPLLAAWMVGALNPVGAYTVLILFGEQGSSKSTAARMIKELIDPSYAPLRTDPRNNRDLMVSAKHSWIPAFDNLSRMTDDLSDGLCRLATGGGLSSQ